MKRILLIFMVLCLVLGIAGCKKKNTNDKEEALAAWALVKDACDSSRYWTNEGSLSQQFLCHFYGEIAHRAGLCEAVGDWDLEPIRPNTGLFQFAINKCNPHD